MQMKIHIFLEYINIFGPLKSIFIKNITHNITFNLRSLNITGRNNHRKRKENFNLNPNPNPKNNLNMQIKVHVKVHLKTINKQSTNTKTTS